MGVSGGWGAGKSTLLRLISKSLRSRGEDEEFLFVEFNAWLYQSFDDARAALMEVIAARLVEHGKATSTGLEKAKALLAQVNWLRVAGLTVGSAASLAVGLPPMGLLGSAWSASRDLSDGVDEGELEAAKEAAKSLTSTSLLRETKDGSPPQQIQEIRAQFEKTLAEMEVTLVVFVDDLDRCLPKTAIATLEAIRLFLFLPGTAFIIAADDRMIREAVRAHFQGANLDEDLVTSYFDKLIQIPLRVPPLGTQEVRAYLMLLFVDASGLEAEEKETVRKEICLRLSRTWKGERVDIRSVMDLVDDCPQALRSNLELADRLAPIMTTARQIAGNPRLIKRFLNTLWIRLTIAESQHVAVDEAALAKMLLFERCAPPKAHAELVAAINDGADGKPGFLEAMERQVNSGEEFEGVEAHWNTSFVKDWLALPPELSGLDLRPVVYVSRDHLPIVTAADQLSSEAAELLEALLGLDSRTSSTLSDQVRSLPGREVLLMLERIMVRARQEQEWGTPPVLWALLTIVEADPDQAEPLARFLKQIDASRISPDLIPVLEDRGWAGEVLDHWLDSKSIPATVKKAIRALRRRDK